MSITSFYFLCLFALTLLLYYLVPKKVQWPLLLLLSIGYFLTSAEVRDSHAWYLILYPMAAVGAVWGAAILIDRTKEQKKKLAALICAVLFLCRSVVHAEILPSGAAGAHGNFVLHADPSGISVRCLL